MIRTHSYVVGAEVSSDGIGPVGRIETLAPTPDEQLASGNSRLSEPVRVLTIIATILMPLSLVAGVYGMNFTRIPGLDSPLGPWFATGVMAAIAIGMLAVFQARKWL